MFPSISWGLAGCRNRPGSSLFAGRAAAGLRGKRFCLTSRFEFIAYKRDA